MLKVYLNNEILAQFLQQGAMVHTRMLSKIERLKKHVIFVYAPEHLRQFSMENGSTKLPKWTERLHQFTKGHYLELPHNGALPIRKKPATLAASGSSAQIASQIAQAFSLEPTQPEIKQLLNQYMPKVLESPNLSNLLEEWQVYMQEHHSAALAPSGTTADIAFPFAAPTLKQKGGTLAALLDMIPKTAHDPKLSLLMQEFSGCLLETVQAEHAQSSKGHAFYAAHCDIWVGQHFYGAESQRGKQHVPKMVGSEEFFNKIEGWMELPQYPEDFIDSVVRLCNHPLVTEGVTPAGEPALALPLDLPFLNFFKEGFFVESPKRELLFLRNYTRHPIFEGELAKLERCLSAILGKASKNAKAIIWTVGRAQLTLSQEQQRAVLKIVL